MLHSTIIHYNCFITKVSLCAHAHHGLWLVVCWKGGGVIFYIFEPLLVKTKETRWIELLFRYKSASRERRLLEQFLLEQC